MFDRARERREQQREEREVFGIRGTATRYRMRQSLISIGDNFSIENDRGERVFRVDGKMLRVRDTLYFEDMQGNTLCKLQQKLLTIKDTMTIEGENGESLATIKKALISPIRDRWTVKIDGSSDLEIKGNVLNYEYEIDDGDRKVAEVSKKWFRITDTYGVQIEPSQNDILILATTVAIDMMSHA